MGEHGVSLENIENTENMENINHVTIYLWFKTLYMWLKTPYLSTRWLKTLHFTAFMATVEKSIPDQLHKAPKAIMRYIIEVL